MTRARSNTLTIESVAGDLIEEIEFRRFCDLILQWNQEELQDIFNYFDDDGSGMISVAEFSTAIQALGDNMSQKDANRLAEHVDSDGSGTIDQDEFCVWLEPLMSISKHQKYLVRRMDTDAEVTLGAHIFVAVDSDKHQRTLGTCGSMQAS